MLPSFGRHDPYCKVATCSGSGATKEDELRAPTRNEQKSPEMTRKKNIKLEEAATTERLLGHFVPLSRKAERPHRTLVQSLWEVHRDTGERVHDPPPREELAPSPKCQWRRCPR